jgi:hypothetical protein
MPPDASRLVMGARHLAAAAHNLYLVNDVADQAAHFAARRLLSNGAVA